MRRISFNAQIIIGAIIGILLGTVLNILGEAHPVFTPALYGAGLVGDIFVNLLKMILIPLVFTSIAVGISNLQAHAQMSRVWKLTLLFFICTTALSVLTGLVIVNVVKPGVGLNVALLQQNFNFNVQTLSIAEFVESFLNQIFLNPVSAMATGDVLPTVIFAVFLGIALIVTGERTRVVRDFLEQLFDVIMTIVNWVMRLAPVGVTALLARLVATQDPELFISLGKFIAVVVFGTLFHGLFNLPFLLWVVTKHNPFVFLREIQQALVTAFSTSSSSATLPVTLRCVQENLRVDKDIAGFVLPLGATVNMDGTALYEAVAAIFVANLAGIELNIVQQVVVFLTAILAAIGAPGIPSAGMVTMVMVLRSVGLPVEAIAILLPIDRFLDALRTSVNVEGDATGSVVVHTLVHKNDAPPTGR